MDQCLTAKFLCGILGRPLHKWRGIVENEYFTLVNHRFVLFDSLVAARNTTWGTVHQIQGMILRVYKGAIEV